MMEHDRGKEIFSLRWANILSLASEWYGHILELMYYTRVFLGSEILHGAGKRFWISYSGMTYVITRFYFYSTIICMFHATHG